MNRQEFVDLHAAVEMNFAGAEEERAATEEFEKDLDAMLAHIEVGNESNRQMVLLAIAQIALRRPGWDHALGLVAEQLDGKQMFDRFKITSASDPCVVSPNAAALFMLEQEYHQGTTVTNCVAHASIPWGQRSSLTDSCRLCRTDMMNQLTWAISLNEFLNQVKDAAITALKGEA